MSELTSNPNKLQWKQLIDEGQLKPLVSIDSKKKWYSLLEISEIWQYRDTLYYLLWRDIKARYKQTILGPFIDVVKPVVSMVVFSLLFGQLAGLPSDGIPYPIFIFTALIPWQLFASGLTLATESVYSAKGLLTKVYFPRLLFPINSILFAIFSQIIPVIILLLMMLFYGMPLSWKAIALPLFALYGMTTSLAVSLWLAPITVRYHDIPQFAAYLVQFWMFATPVVYSTSLIPKSWQFIYNLNPLTLVVNGWRWALLGVHLKVDFMAYVAMAAVILLLIGGIIFFKRMEESFADVI